MIKFILILLVLFLNNCSFDNKSGIWTNDETFESTNQKIQNLFESEKILEDELNTNFVIETPLKLGKSKINYDGVLNHNLIFKKISRYKFSKINNFDYFDPTLIFYNDDLIFFNKKGSILRFDNNSKVIWEKNFYTKNDKKMSPRLTF